MDDQQQDNLHRKNICKKIKYKQIIISSTECKSQADNHLCITKMKSKWDFFLILTKSLFSGSISSNQKHQEFPREVSLQDQAPCTIKMNENILAEAKTVFSYITTHELNKSIRSCFFLLLK